MLHRMKKYYSTRIMLISMLIGIQVLLQYGPQTCQAIIPSECVHNVTRHHVCCPIPKGGYQRCGGPRQGKCMQISLFRDKVQPIWAQDDRTYWPTRFFQYMCRCEGNFFGLACDECWYGWTGRNCDQKVQYVRQNWAKMSARKKQDFLNVMDRSFHEPSGYMIMIEQENWRSDPIRQPIFTPANVHYFMVFLHRFCSRTTLYNTKSMCEAYGVLDFNHDGSAFVTWHRYFMMFWERALQRIAEKYYNIKDFTIPYWNWLDATRCEVCTDDMAGGEGLVDKFGKRLSQRSVFYNWTEYCSEPTNEPTCYGCHYSGHFGKLTRRWNSNKMPTTQDLDYVMSLKKFYVHQESDGTPCKSFHMAIEGYCGPPGADTSKLFMHNYVHNCVDGTFCCSAPATTDPLFLVHHVEVDRQVEAWFRDNKPQLFDLPNDGVRPGHCRECHIVGFLPPVPHKEIFKSTLDLGYTYDSFEFGKQGRVYGTGDGKAHHISEFNGATSSAAAGGAGSVAASSGTVSDDTLLDDTASVEDIGSASTSKKKK